MVSLGVNIKRSNWNEDSEIYNDRRQKEWFNKDLGVGGLGVSNFSDLTVCPLLVQ